MAKIALHVITMNRDEMLDNQLSLVRPYVDTIRVCDGAGSRVTKKICRKHKAKYYHRQWDDDFAAQDNLLFSKAKAGEWILVQDSDEFPSKELLQRLRELAGRGGYNCVRIPSITILDDIPECTVQDRIEANKSGHDIFRKDWFFEFTKGIYSTGSPHRGFHYPDRWIYHDTGYPYYHIKTTDDFIFNDCIHSFINPEGQEYTPDEETEFRACECIKGLKLSTEVLPMLKDGQVTNDFIEFMWKYKDEDRPISRWFWAYYFLFHKDKLPDDFDFENDTSHQNYLKHKRGYKPFEVRLS